MRAQQQIIVVEDNELNSKLLLDQLEAREYDVVAVKDAGDAARAATRSAPDLVLLMISSLTAICEAARLLRLCAVTCRIVAISPVPVPFGDRQLALESGCYDYVV